MNGPPEVSVCRLFLREHCQDFPVKSSFQVKSPNPITVTREIIQQGIVFLCVFYSSSVLQELGASCQKMFTRNEIGKNGVMAERPRWVMLRSMRRDVVLLVVSSTVVRGVRNKLMIFSTRDVGEALLLERVHSEPDLQCALTTLRRVVDEIALGHGNEVKN